MKNLAMLWFPAVVAVLQHSGTSKMIRKESSSPACTATVANPETALEATLGEFPELAGPRLSVDSVKFHCHAGYTTDGEAPREGNQGFEVKCGGEHEGCKPIPCSLIPIKLVGVKPSVPLEEARVGDWVTFAADQDHSFDGRSVIASTTGKKLLCTGEGWVENAAGLASTRMGAGGFGVHIPSVIAQPVTCLALDDAEAARMHVESPGAQGIKLHESVQLLCLSGYTFGYADGLDACGDCPAVLERTQTVACALNKQATAILETAGIECRPIQCDVPAAATTHTASVSLPQRDGEDAARLTFDETFQVQCEDTARPGGDADAPNEPFDAKCFEDGIQPPVGWCESVECKAWQGKDQGGAKGAAGARRVEQCPEGESVDGGDRRTDGNDGAHEYECKKDENTAKFWWHCAKGSHCGDAAMIDHTAADVTHPCLPVECPTKEVGDHTAKLVWEEKGSRASLEGSAFFGTAIQAACLPGYDLQVDSTPWPAELALDANRLWADLGACNDHAAFASLEPLGDALGCEPTDGYCPVLTAAKLAEVGLEPMSFEQAEAEEAVEDEVDIGKLSYARTRWTLGSSSKTRLSKSSKTRTVGSKASVQCLEGYHYTGAYSDVALGAALEVGCRSHHADATPGAGGGVWLPQLKNENVPLGKEPVCVPIICTAPAKHESSGALRQGPAEVGYGEVASYRCPDGQVMAEVAGEQRLVPEKAQAKYGGGTCTSQYVISSSVEWLQSKRGAGLAAWRCFADCGKLEDQVQLTQLGLELAGTGVTHVVPEETPKHASLLEEHGSAYGTLTFASSGCFGAAGRSARLRCGEDGEWQIRLGEAPAKPLSQVWDVAQQKYASLDFVRAMGVQLHVLDDQHKRGGKCLAAKGDNMEVVGCDPLAIEQRFDYPEANSQEDLAGLIVSAQSGQCVKLTGGSQHGHSAANQHGEKGGRQGQFVVGPCGDQCAADEDSRECSRGDLLTETRPLKWGSDPDCPFFISMKRPEGTPAEFHAAFEHPCIAMSGDGSCQRRSRRAGSLGAVGIGGTRYSALEGADAVVNYKGRPEDTFSILVE